MQQADRAHSGADTGTSPGNSHNFSASRRGALGMLGALPMLAASVPASASMTAGVRQWDMALRDLAKA